MTSATPPPDRSTPARAPDWLDAIPAPAWLLLPESLVVEAVNSAAIAMLQASPRHLLGSPFSSLGVSPSFIRTAQDIRLSSNRSEATSLYETLELITLGVSVEVILRLAPIETPQGVRLLVTCERFDDEAGVEPPPSSRRPGLGTFYASLGRELRMPLATVLGFLDLVDDPSTPSAERSTWCQRARESGERLMQKVQDLVDLGQLENGELVAHPQPFETSVAIGQAVSAATERVRRDPSSILVSYTTPVPRWLPFDSGRFQQVLSTILEFATIHSAAPSVTLQIAVIGQKPERHLALDVSAADSTLRRKDLEGIFDPFARVPAQAHLRSWKISLALARGLAQRMGGDLQATVVDDRLLLRMTTSSPEREDLQLVSLTVQTSPAPPPVDERPSFNARRVAIAGGDANDRMMLRALLERVGLSVEELSAEQLLQRRPLLFDAVVVDVDLPEHDGPSLLQSLRAAGETIPALVVTSSTSAQEEKTYMEAGATAYLVKPVQRETLWQKLQLLFTGGQAAPSSETGPQPIFPKRSRSSSTMPGLGDPHHSSRLRRMLHFVEHIAIALEMEDYGSVVRACGQLTSLAQRAGLNSFREKVRVLSHLASTSPKPRAELLETMRQLRHEAARIRRALDKG